MAENPHIDHPSIVPFWNYWHRCYPGLGDADRQWFTRHATVMRQVSRQHRVFVPGQRPDYLYFVCGGLLAALQWDGDARRRIHNLTPTGYSLLATDLDREHDMEIVALRASAVICIRIHELDAYGSCTEAGAALARALSDSRYMQCRLHTGLLLIADEKKRYLEFTRSLPDILHITTQAEQADFLNISRASITRVRRMR